MHTIRSSTDGATISPAIICITNHRDAARARAEAMQRTAQCAIGSIRINAGAFGVAAIAERLATHQHTQQWRLAMPRRQ